MSECSVCLAGAVALRRVEDLDADAGYMLIEDRWLENSIKSFDKLRNGFIKDFLISFGFSIAFMPKEKGLQILFIQDEYGYTIKHAQVNNDWERFMDLLLEVSDELKKIGL